MTKFILQVLAMIFMVCDHAGATILPSVPWLGWIGRLAFPIFAFFLVEGYFKTSNYKAYLKRMFLFAAITEIPFNYMAGMSFIYPFHQNVMWTFFIALLYLKVLDKILNLRGKQGSNLAVKALGTFGKLCLAGALTIFVYLLGFLTMVDYHGYSMLMVLVFYVSQKFMDFLSKKEWTPALTNRLMVMIFQVVTMYHINVEMIMGEYRTFHIFGRDIDIVIQGFALLALPLIWLYNGNKGYSSKRWQMFCYAFYPLHIAFLVALALILH